MVESSRTREWITRSQQGDTLALSKLLASYHAVLRARTEQRMDSTLRAKVEPEDVLQEVYLDVFRLINRFEDRGAGSFLNWALTILDSKLADAGRTWRRKMRDVARETPPQAGDGTGSYWNLLDQLYADKGTPSRIVRHDEAVAALLACIPRLPELQRRVVQLRMLEGQPVAEVARRLGKSPDMIVSLTRRALNALHESMDRMGEFTRNP